MSVTEFRAKDPAGGIKYMVAAACGAMSAGNSQGALQDAWMRDAAGQCSR